MKVIHLYYFAGIIFLVGANRSLWRKLLNESDEKRRQNELVFQNKNIEKRFETHVLVYDSLSGKWINPYPYFQTIEVDMGKKITQQVQTKTEENDDENASASS